jgi:hypothetical protein
MFSRPASLFQQSDFFRADFFGTDSLFGFLRRFGRKRAASRPVAAGRSGGTLVLVSQEDIYGRGQRRQPILLLRKGQEIPAHDLPKLIQNGIRPDQVRFQYAPDDPATESPDDRVDAWMEYLGEKGGEDARLWSTQGMTPPGSVLPRRPSALPASGSRQDEMAHPYGSRAVPGYKPHTERGRQTVLLLEPDPKHLKRLIDCLFGCGFSLNRIHPLRIPAHLSWALERHRPDILIADSRFIAEEGGLAALQEKLTPGFGPERVILTLDPQTNSSRPAFDASPSAFDVFPEESGPGKGLVQLLRKPASRSAMKRLLNEEASPILF